MSPTPSFARQFPSHTSAPESWAVKACDPIGPLQTHPSDVSSTPCMKKTTFFASFRGRRCMVST